jgi:hypothetical protein
MNNRIFRALLEGFIEKHRSEEHCDCEVNSIEFLFDPSSEVISAYLICQNTHGRRFLVASGKIFFSRLPQDVRCELIKIGGGVVSIPSI